jgi:ketosteroid isomerase-like protein
MKSRWQRILMSVSRTLVIGMIFHGFALQSQAQEPTVAAIKEVLAKQEQDWNQGNLDGFLEGYWNSPGIVFQSGGNRSVGFEAMRDRYRKRYQAEGKAMGRVAFSEVEIVPLSADSAFVRGRWGLTMPDGKKPGGLFTLIFRKFPNGWKIVHDHTSVAEEAVQPAGTPVPPPPPPPPTPARPPG